MGRHVETAEYAGMVRRVLRAMGRRASDDVDALAELVALRAELDRVADQAARDCHAAGYSWTEIARALGVSRQAARQRFALPGQDREAAQDARLEGTIGGAILRAVREGAQL